MSLCIKKYFSQKCLPLRYYEFENDWFIYATNVNLNMLLHIDSDTSLEVTLSLKTILYDEVDEVIPVCFLLP